MPDQLVLVTDHNFPDLSIEQNAFGEGTRVEELQTDDEEQARKQFAEADAVLVRMYDLDATTIEQMENCEAISRYGIGVDHIDVDAATREEIYVGNAPTYCLEEVSLHTISLMLNLARRVKEYDNLIAGGDWKGVEVFADYPIQRFSKQTIGIVGFGKIGREVADKLNSIGGNILVSDPYLSPEDVSDMDVELTDFDSLVQKADYVTIHSPLTDETRGLFTNEVFMDMKDTASLVNASRGPIVDTDALVDAIDSGELAGAGLDVFPDEPLSDQSPIRDHEKIIATPHIAYYSEAADVERREQAIRNIQAALRGERPPYALNDF